MKKKMIAAVSLFLMALCLTACGKEKAVQDFDLENDTHLTKQLEEHVEIDADVTPYGAYKDGVSAYYISSYKDGMDMTASSYEENPILFGTSLAEQTNLMKEYFGIELEASEAEIMFSGSDSLSLQLKDKSENVFFAYWFVNDAGLIEDPHIYYPNQESVEFQISYLSVLQNGTEKFADTLYSNASSDVQTLADRAKEFVKIFTGNEVADDCLCIPLSDMEGDCYAFYCFYETDGIPWMKQGLTSQFSADANISDEVQSRYYDEDGALNLYVYSAEVFCRNGKFAAMNLFDFVSVGEVYREKETVITAENLLAILENYYEKTLLARDVTITDIRLVYNGWFSDSEDGTVENILSPFWYVQYYMGEYDEETDDGTFSYGNHCLIFDAYTGKFMSDSMIFE